jgi:hypothetical protein
MGGAGLSGFVYTLAGCQEKLRFNRIGPFLVRIFRDFIAQQDRILVVGNSCAILRS